LRQGHHHYLSEWDRQDNHLKGDTMRSAHRTVALAQ
jgi:hypothetical protein